VIRGVNEIYSRSIKHNAITRQHSALGESAIPIVRLSRLHSAPSRTHADMRGSIPFSRNLAPAIPRSRSPSFLRVHRRSRKSNNSRAPRGIRSHLPSRDYRSVLFASSHVRPRFGTASGEIIRQSARARDACCLNYKSRKSRRERLREMHPSARTANEELAGCVGF